MPQCALRHTAPNHQAVPHPYPRVPYPPSCLLSRRAAAAACPVPPPPAGPRRVVLPPQRLPCPVPRDAPPTPVLHPRAPPHLLLPRSSSPLPPSLPMPPAKCQRCLPSATCFHSHPPFNRRCPPKTTLPLKVHACAYLPCKLSRRVRSTTGWRQLSTLVEATSSASVARCVRSATTARPALLGHPPASRHLDALQDAQPARLPGGGQVRC